MWIRSRGASMCPGPNDAGTSSESVHALNTRSRGALKLRVIRTSWPVDAVRLRSLILLSFPGEVRVETVQRASHVRLRDCIHSTPRRAGRPQPARPPLSLPAADDRSGDLAQLQVAGDRRQAHGERLRSSVTV